MDSTELYSKHILSIQWVNFWSIWSPHPLPLPCWVPQRSHIRRVRARRGGSTSPARPALWLALCCAMPRYAVWFCLFSEVDVIFMRIQQSKLWTPQNHDEGLLLSTSVNRCRDVSGIAWHLVITILPLTPKGQIQQVRGTRHVRFWEKKLGRAGSHCNHVLLFTSPDLLVNVSFCDAYFDVHPSQDVFFVCPIVASLSHSTQNPTIKMTIGVSSPFIDRDEELAWTSLSIWEWLGPHSHTWKKYRSVQCW